MAELFNRTPAQIKQEMDNGIENLHRQLTAAQGHSEQGHSSLLRGLLVMFVLLGQFLFTLYFDSAATTSNKNSRLTEDANDTDSKIVRYGQRDEQILESLLRRIDDSADAVLATKMRVAPNMQVDHHLGSIKASTGDARNVLGIPAVRPALADRAPLPIAPAPSTSASGEVQTQ